MPVHASPLYRISHKQVPLRQSPRPEHVSAGAAPSPPLAATATNDDDEASFAVHPINAFSCDNMLIGRHCHSSPLARTIRNYSDDTSPRTNALLPRHTSNARAKLGLARMTVFLSRLWWWGSHNTHDTISGSTSSPIVLLPLYFVSRGLSWRCVQFSSIKVHFVLQWEHWNESSNNKTVN